MEIVNVKRGAPRVPLPPNANLGNRPAQSATSPVLTLDRVIGISGSQTAAHPCIPGTFAYLAGGTAVLYDSRTKQQLRFFRSKRATARSLTCLAFSKDAGFLAAGERAPAPELLVWEVTTGRCVQALKGHKLGITSVSFSQDGKTIASTGSDAQLCIWEWQAGACLARVSTQADVLSSACFSDDGGCVLSVGKQHFKVWSIGSQPGVKAARAAGPAQLTLTPRPVGLKDYKSADFVDVSAAPTPAGQPSGAGGIYALTRTGFLLLMRAAGRTLDKSVDLQVRCAFKLATSSTMVACACAQGTVRIFATKTLAFRCSLPRPLAHVTGAAAVEATGGEGGGVGHAGTAPPDAVGVSFDSSSTPQSTYVVYADHSIITWDVRDPSKVSRLRCILSHADAVWDAAIIPSWQVSMLGLAGTSSSSTTPLPTSSDTASADGEQAGSGGGSACLVTGGSDGTVRLWNMAIGAQASTSGPAGLPLGPAATARCTRTLRATIHVEPLSSPGLAAGRRCTPETPLPHPAGTTGTTAASSFSGARPSWLPTLRCLRVSPNGQHLAVGDTLGNLRVYDLRSLSLIASKEAHDSDIMSMDYSRVGPDGACYLATGSRDTLIHVFNVARGYDLVATCDLHGAAVTAVRFVLLPPSALSAAGASGGSGSGSARGVGAGSGGASSRLVLMSASADKTVVFRHVVKASALPGDLELPAYAREATSRGIVYDLAVDGAGSNAVAVGQGFVMRLFDVASGRVTKTLQQDSSGGEAVRVSVDPSGQVALCACTDGSVCVYDLSNGQQLARGAGHGDIATCCTLLEGHQGLASVSGDGCVFLWRLPPALSARFQGAAAQAHEALVSACIKARQADKAAKKTPAPVRKGWAGSAVDVSSTVLRVQQGKPLMSLEKLPKWAQREGPPLVIGQSASAALATPQLSQHTAQHGVQSVMPSPGLSSAGAAEGANPGPVLWAQAMHTAAELAAASGQLPSMHDDMVVLQSMDASSTSGSVHAAPAAAAMVGVAAPAGPAAGDHVQAVSGMSCSSGVEEEDDIVCYSPVEGDEEAHFYVLANSDELDAKVLAAAAGGVGGGSSFTATTASQQRLQGYNTSGKQHDQDSEDEEDGKQASMATGTDHAQAAAATGGNTPEVDGAGSLCGTPQQQQDVCNDAEEDAMLESGCASNRMCTPAPVAVEGMNEEGARRDLFKEQFDKLDAASGTKRPLDPSRQSLSDMFRQVRSSLVLPQGQAINGATAIAGTGAGGMSTPPIPKLNLACVTTQRGCGGVGGVEVDGTVVSTWTPDHTLLPLKSPGLARAHDKQDTQLGELARIKERLMGSLLKSTTKQPLSPAAAGAASAVAAAIQAAASQLPTQVAATTAAAAAAGNGATAVAVAAKSNGAAGGAGSSVQAVVKALEASGAGKAGGAAMGASGQAVLTKSSSLSKQTSLGREGAKAVAASAAAAAAGQADAQKPAAAAAVQGQVQQAAKAAPQAGTSEAAGHTVAGVKVAHDAAGIKVGAAKLGPAAAAASALSKPQAAGVTPNSKPAGASVGAGVAVQKAATAPQQQQTKASSAAPPAEQKAAAAVHAKAPAAAATAGIKPAAPAAAGKPAATTDITNPAIAAVAAIPALTAVAAAAAPATPGFSQLTAPGPDDACYPPGITTAAHPTTAAAPISTPGFSSLTSTSHAGGILGSTNAASDASGSNVMLTPNGPVGAVAQQGQLLNPMYNATPGETPPTPVFCSLQADGRQVGAADAHKAPAGGAVVRYSNEAFDAPITPPAVSFGAALDAVASDVPAADGAVCVTRMASLSAHAVQAAVQEVSVSGSIPAAAAAAAGSPSTSQASVAAASYPLPAAAARVGKKPKIVLPAMKLKEGSTTVAAAAAAAPPGVLHTTAQPAVQHPGQAAQAPALDQAPPQTPIATLPGPESSMLAAAAAPGGVSAHVSTCAGARAFAGQQPVGLSPVPLQSPLRRPPQEYERALVRLQSALAEVSMLYCELQAAPEQAMQQQQPGKAANLGSAMAMATAGNRQEDCVLVSEQVVVGLQAAYKQQLGQVVQALSSIGMRPDVALNGSQGSMNQPCLTQAQPTYASNPSMHGMLQPSAEPMSVIAQQSYAGMPVPMHAPSLSPVPSFAPTLSQSGAGLGHVGHDGPMGRSLASCMEEVSSSDVMLEGLAESLTNKIGDRLTSAVLERLMERMMGQRQQGQGAAAVGGTEAGSQ